MNTNTPHRAEIINSNINNIEFNTSSDNDLQISQKLKNMGNNCGISIEHEAQIERHYREVVTTLVFAITNSDMSEIEKQYKIQRFGIPLFDYNKEVNLIIDLKKPKKEQISSKQSTFFKSILVKDYLKISKMIASDEIPVTAGIGQQSLLSFIINQNSKISINDLEILINSGLVIDLEDLQSATLAKLSSVHLDILYSYYAGDIDESWTKDGNKFNLLTLATSYLNSEATVFWHSKGVSFSAGDNTINALDMLPNPRDELELDEALVIFDLLVMNNVYPFDFNSLASIKMWLPESSITTYEFFLENSEQNRNNVIAELGAILNDFDKSVISDIQDLTNKRYKLRKSVRKCKNFLVRNSNSTAGIIMNGDELESLSQTEKRLLIDIQVALFNKNWEHYKVLRESIKNNFQGLLIPDIELLQLIINDAPVDYIENVLTTDTMLKKEHIVMIISNNNITLLEKIWPYNYEVQPSDLVIALTLLGVTKSKLSPEMNEFLLLHNIIIE